MFVYKNETLWFSHIVEADKENDLQTEVIVCPPYTMRTELFILLCVLTREQIGLMAFQKESIISTKS